MPKKLLLADDSITIQKVVGITFAQEDYEITYTDNGEDAVKKAKEVKPDVILADIIMPQRNGYEVCEIIKADPALSHIPVLLLAGTFETFDESRGKKAGADGYIVKPFESQALIDKVNSLASKKAAPVSAPQAPTKPEAPRPTPVPTVAPQFITQPAKVEPEPVDKRMEPMLEFDLPTQKTPEVSIGGDIFSQAEELAQIDYTTEPPIDLASPADFIMQATTPPETFAEPKPEPPVETKAEPVEPAKHPTFDFISGESDLKPEAPKAEEPKFTGFPDFSSTEEPKETFKMPEPIEPSFEVPSEMPSPDLGPDIVASRQAVEEITQAPTEIPKVVTAQAPSNVSIPDDKLEAMVRKMVQNIIEKIAWEVVPDTAEKIIKEEIKRLTESKQSK